MPQTPVRLDDHGVTFTPGRLGRLRGQVAWTVPFGEIMGLTLTEPRGMHRGQLLLKPTAGTQPRVVEFGSGELLAMRRLHIEIWTRVRRARDGRGSNPEASQDSPQ